MRGESSLGQKHSKTYTYGARRILARERCDVIASRGSAQHTLEIRIPVTHDVDDPTRARLRVECTQYRPTHTLITVSRNLDKESLISHLYSSEMSKHARPLPISIPPLGLPPFRMPLTSRVGRE